METLEHPAPVIRRPARALRVGPLALAALSGALLLLAYPGVDAGWLAWVALVPLLVAIRRSSLPGAFALGWVTGAIWFGGILSWLRLFGVPPFNTILWFLTVTIQALAPALFALAARWLWIGRRGPLLVVPALWMLTEWLRCSGSWGFPWGVLGETQARWSTLIQCADLGGAWLVSFLMAWANAVVADLARWPSARPLAGGGNPSAAKALWASLSRPPRGKRETTSRSGLSLLSLRGGGTGAFLLVLAAVLLYGALPRPEAAGPALRVTLVQAGHDFGEYLALTRAAAAGQPDLVVWPETVVPGDPLQNPAIMKVLAEAAREGGFALLAGAPHQDAGGGLKNAAILVGPDGERAGFYEKVHLVPFGEFIPFRRWLPFLDRFPTVTDMSAGESYHTLGTETGRLPRLGAMICFESTFSEISRALVRDGAGLLVVLTSDASFDETSAPEHHARKAIFRAIETRRPVLQAATTGVTFAVDPRGRVLDRLPMFRPGALTVSVIPAGIPTPYARLGDWVIVACALFVVSLAARRRRRG